MRNTLMDLNNLLFEQMERLMDDDLDQEKEFMRAKALKGLAETAISNAELSLQAEKFKQEMIYQTNVAPELPKMLENTHE